MATHATLSSALTAANVSIRLTAALAIGADPDPGLVELVFERCAVEPDFYVRDMLTWALTRFPNDVTVPRLLAELGAGSSQARSQALHTLSKIKDARTWPAITRSLLRDPDDDVARSAWRAAVVLVPDDQRQELARELAAQLGRGNREVRLSLSRALISLGEEVIEPLLQEIMAGRDPLAQAHASATERLLRDPNASFEAGLWEAKRAWVLGKPKS